MTGWDLPEALEVAGALRPIHADFRDILDVLGYLNDQENEEMVRVYIALSLFYENLEDIPDSAYQEAISKMYWFLNGGETVDNTRPAPKTIDWEQDRPLIVADVNKVAGCEVRALGFCHWWTFLAWFGAIGEGQLSTVVAIREKLRKHKPLSQWERDYLRQNPERVEFRQKYSKDEDDAFQAWGV